MQTAARLGGVLLVLWLYCSTVSGQGYDYSNGPNGTANWGNLPGSAICATGTRQSPINLPLLWLNYVYNTPLDVSYTSNLVQSEIYNNGLTPTVEVKENNTVAVLIIDGVTYNLKDFHFHIPSEHTIFYSSFAMELHLVHVSAAGQIAVIGLLYKVGYESEFLAQFFHQLPPFSPRNVRTSINITLPSLEDDFYYRYDGSLTTPPCSEGVVWTVLKHVYTLSQAQLDKLAASIPGPNARPIQARNGRTVSLIKE